MPTHATHHHTHEARPWRATALWWFISLSLMLHGAVLTLLQQAPSIAVAESQSAGISIQLVERQQAKATAKTRPVPRPQSVAARPAKSEPTGPLPNPDNAKPEVSPTANAAAISPQAEAHATGSEAPPDSVALDEAALHASLKEAVQLELARHFTYPLLARKRGWQGEVVLAFRLETDGSISDARIARSSGYGLLDRAALTVLGKIKRIGNGAPRDFAMQLPVIYRLEG